MYRKLEAYIYGVCIWSSRLLQSCCSCVAGGLWWKYDFHLEYFSGELACQFDLEGNCVIHETKCLLLPCFSADISWHPPSPPSLSSSLHNPCLIAQTVMYGASLKTLLRSQMSLQWDIGSKEPICIHANEAEWVHPSWWACKHALMNTHKPLNPSSL